MIFHIHKNNLKSRYLYKKGIHYDYEKDFKK